MERAEAIIAACRDTMLTTLEKIGGQSLICSWTRQDGSVVKLALEIRTSDQTTIGDAIRDMDDEEMARKLVPAVLALVRTTARRPKIPFATGWNARKAISRPEIQTQLHKPLLIIQVAARRMNTCHSITRLTATRWRTGKRWLSSCR